MEKNKIKQIEDYLRNHEKFKNSYLELFFVLREKRFCDGKQRMYKSITDDEKNIFQDWLRAGKVSISFPCKEEFKTFFYDYLRKEISWVQDFNSDPKNGSLPLKKLSPKESLEMMRTLKWSSYQMRRCKRVLVGLKRNFIA